jgi:hypothetical protein
MKKRAFCAEDIQDAAIVCKHCGRDIVVTPPPPTAKKPMTPTRLAFIAIGITYAILAIYNLLRITPRALTPDHRLVVSSVHQKHAWNPPVSLDLRNGIINVDYNCEGSAIPPRTVTRDRLEYIRAALKPYHFDDYRVSCSAVLGLPSTDTASRVSLAMERLSGKKRMVLPSRRNSRSEER